MKRWLRTEVGERIDHADFQHGVEAGPRDAISGVNEAMLVGERNVTRVQSPKAFITKGFTVRHGGASVYVIEKDDLTGEGSAVLSFRENGEVKFGCVLIGGQPQKQIDIASFPVGTYGVFIRLEFRDTETGNRLFWNATAPTPVEFPRAIATRRAADWAVTIELTQPGPEWIKIADVTQAGAAPTDRRDFFFEGRDDASFLVTDAEWGDADDRSNFRDIDGVFGIYRFIRSVQRLFQDIKGDGLGWWIAPAVSLLNVLDLAATRAIAGVILPDGSGTRNFGSAGLRWAEGFFTDLSVSNNVAAGSNVTATLVIASGNISSSGGDLISDTGVVRGTNLEATAVAPGSPVLGRAYNDTLVFCRGFALTDGVGGISSSGGVNLASVTIVGGLIRIAFNTGAASAASYSVIVTEATTAGATGSIGQIWVENKGSGGFDIVSAPSDPGSVVVRIDFVCIGI